MSTKVSKKSVRVYTTSYRFSHGKNPRGFGCWCFEIDAPDGSILHRFYTANYGKAKADAISEAAEAGSTSVRLMS